MERAHVAARVAPLPSPLPQQRAVFHGADRATEVPPPRVVLTELREERRHVRLWFTGMLS